MTRALTRNTKIPGLSSPLYAANNVQGAGKCDWRVAQTLQDPDVVRYQDAYVRKTTQEVNSFDNVILEICDEPGHIAIGFELVGLRAVG
jgi:hypothetical protein